MLLFLTILPEPQSNLAGTKPMIAAEHLKPLRRYILYSLPEKREPNRDHKGALRLHYHAFEKDRSRGFFADDEYEWMVCIEIQLFWSRTCIHNSIHLNHSD